jgi:hypothetical protein
MIRSSAWLAIIASLVAALAAGCAPQPTVVVEKTAPGVVRPVPASESDALLGYYQSLRGLSAADLGREHDAARQAYARARSDYNRVRYAMVLTLPGAAFQDDGRALEMLEPVARNPNGQLQPLAHLLATHLQDRKRLDANAQALQQKLDALRSLERNMIERKR